MSSILTFSPSFDNKKVNESVVLGMDFTNLLGDGETLDVPTTVLSVVLGTDAAVAAMLSGSPAVSSVYVLQRVINCVDEAIYKLRFTVTTSSGNTFIEDGYFEVCS